MDEVIKFMVYASFIKLNGELIPWNIMLTSTSLPIKTIVIGLDTKDLNFKYEDICYNMERLDDFPRPDSLKLNHEIPLSQFKNGFYDIFMHNYWTDGWVTQMATTDRQTYNYIKEIFIDIKMLPCNLLAEDRNEAAVYRYNNIKLVG